MTSPLTATARPGRVLWTPYLRYDYVTTDKTQRRDPSYYQRSTVLGLACKLSDNIGLRVEGHANHGYAGESKSWSNGGAIVAFDLPEDNPARAAFASEVMGKNLGNMKALWAQNVFTGKAVPPKVLPSDDEVKKAVAANKGAIGYIKAGAADDSVKVVVK